MTSIDSAEISKQFFSCANLIYFNPKRLNENITFYALENIIALHDQNYFLQ